ncbi:hypothetical protein FRC04_005774 [Tulasnella sp. 424]|nr:hypothetical protein FRC04_005774 [Tulasnella sp. 424]KAG8961930.1 hypothetical protein FRC05_005653 [Tulasnella sp. 425]
MEPSSSTLPSQNLPPSSQALTSGAPGVSLELQTRQLEPTNSEPQARQLEPATLELQTRQLEPATSDLQTRQSKPTTVPPVTPSKSLSPAKRPPPPLHRPIEEQPYSEVRLGHPLFLSVEARGSGSPAWLQLRAALQLWGSRVSSLSVAESQILLSLSARKPDIAHPSVLVSSISIAQTFLSLQKPDPHLPHCPIIKLSPTCGLDSIAPLHHVRFVIGLILNVEAPLPTAKFIESNLPLEPDAIKAFFRVLEKSLKNFIDSLTKDEEAVRYAEVEYLTMIRLTLFVRSTAFMVNNGLQDNASRRVTSAMDHLVTVLGAVSVVRYVEAYMGGAAERWYAEEGLKRTPASQVWFYVWQLFKTAAPSLASALVQGRSDIFNYRGLESIIPSSLKGVFDQILTQPVWWSALGNGVPEAFVIGMKQFIPSTTTFDCLQAVEWWRLSFIDRVVVLMTIFGAAVQLSAEPMDSPHLQVPEQRPSKSLFERLEVCCSSMMRTIGEEAGPEDGLKFTKDVSEREEQRERQMRGWILVWEAERGPSFPFVPTVPNPSTHPTASASPAELKSPQSTDAPKPPEGLLSQGSSIVPTTPSAHYDEDDDGPGGAQLPKLPTISEDAEMADVDAVLSGGLSDGDSNGVEGDKGDLNENVLQEKPASRKRKVAGDSLQIEENPAAADGRHKRPCRLICKALISAAPQPSAVARKKNPPIGPALHRARNLEA